MLVTHALTPEDLTAQKDRLYASILLREGVVDVAGGSFEVNEDTGSNLSVRIGSGVVGDKAVVEGDSTADQGNYVVLSADATATVTLSAGDNSDPRIDRVGILVQDDEADSSGQSEAILTVVEGTPSSSPSAPAEPDNFLTLALVEVAAQASAVTNSDIEDTRVEAHVRGQHVETVVFESPGATPFVKADYPWLRRVKVRVQGGGGAGGGAAATGSGQSSAGAGGQGGAYVEDWIAVEDLSSSETVTVGAGGAANSGASGGNGGQSSFGSHVVAGGGTGGTTAGASATPNGVNGPNDPQTLTPASGVYRTKGQGGGAAIRYTDIRAMGGMGGSSHLGGGGAGTAASTGGSPGGFRGGGGGGAANPQSTAAQAGGAGGSGVVIVELYA